MVLRQVLSDGRVFIRRSIPLMGSDQCAFIEYLHPIRRVDDLYLLSGISIGSAVVVPVFANLDVTVVANGEAHVLFDQKGRSEERRVGKECSARWGTEREEEK